MWRDRIPTESTGLRGQAEAWLLAAGLAAVAAFSPLASAAADPLPLRDAIREHGKDVFTIKLIHEVATEAAADVLERQFIKHWKTRWPAGLNVTSGGRRGFDNPESKTRQRGETNSCAKLTSAKVIEIRELAKNSTLTQREIAGLYGVHNTTVSMIVKGKSWKHLPL